MKKERKNSIVVEKIKRKEKKRISREIPQVSKIDAGKVLIEGIDIRDIMPEELRTRVGVVLQDPCIFAGSIEFNICLGDEKARARVREAAATVGAVRFIESRPAGYADEARERGSNFSVGEKQLISFARAVAFNPEILLLDTLHPWCFTVTALTRSLSTPCSRLLDSVC